MPNDFSEGELILLAFKLALGVKGDLHAKIIQQAEFQLMRGEDAGNAFQNASSSD